MTWNPAQYLKFGAERLRPAQDLLARVPLDAPGSIVDLGCGTGALTALARTRWPEARIAGVDNSPAMLERARAAVDGVVWELADLATWRAGAPVDLIASNAALHWLDDHARLFPHLVAQLREGGVLAVQMPAQHEAPSHRIAYDLAESAPWRAQLGAHVRRAPILSAPSYYALLRPHVSALEMWFTEYVQVLSGDGPVAEFTKGSFVGVWLAALPEEDARQFEAQYRAALADHYPRQPDGTTLFPFRRFFLLATR